MAKKVFRHRIFRSHKVGQEEYNIQDEANEWFYGNMCMWNMEQVTIEQLR